MGGVISSFADPTGSGTKTDPYLIGSKEDLYWFRDYVNSDDETNGHASACAQLTADIDLSSDNAFESIGNNRPYKGVLDGNGKTIKHLAYDYSLGSSNYLGLIGLARGATVKNLCFENVYFNRLSQATNFCAGVVAGYAEDSEFDNIVVKTGRMFLYSTNWGIGGIVGVAAGSHIKNCVNYINVGGREENIGGICGEIFSYNGEATTIENCANYGTITSWRRKNIGGIVGYVDADTNLSNVFNNGSIVVSWSSSTTAGNNSVGLIIGGVGDRVDVNANGIVAYNKDCPIRWEQMSSSSEETTLKFTESVGIGYNKEPYSGSVTGFDTELLKSGILAYLLQEGTAKEEGLNAWGQNLGEDDVPVFGSTATVYPNGDVKRTCQWALTGEFTNDASKEGTLTVTHENAIHHDAVAPTCYATGTKEHYECADCHRTFVDEAMTEEIDVVIPEVHATPIYHEIIEATCTKDGTVAYYECSNCHRKFYDEAMTKTIYGLDFVIPAKGHKYVDGVCSVCGKKESELEIGKNILNIKEYDYSIMSDELYYGYFDDNIYQFVPEEDGKLIVYSDLVPTRMCGILCDKDKNRLAYSFYKNNGDINDFILTSDVKKGETYYIGVRAADSYQAIDSCQVFMAFADEDAELNFIDKTTYNLGICGTHKTLAYKRTFNNTNWQPLYVPFAMEASDWTSQGLEVACIDNFHEYNSAEGNKVVLEVSKVTEGSLHPNTPYLIKADETGEKTITLNNATVDVIKSNTFTCSSMTRNYNFIGTTAAKSKFDDTDLIVSGGKLMGISEGAELSAQRWYINITDRKALIGEEPSATQAPRSIAIKVIGEGNATGIENIRVKDDNAPALNGIYDLQGRKLTTMPEKGVFIVNGKKYVK